jgi:hypothetical protein
MLPRPVCVPVLFMVGQTVCHPTFYPAFLFPPFQVFLEAESVVAAELSPEVAVAAEPRVSALVLVVADLSPASLALVAGPGVALVMAELSPEVAVAAEPRVSALVFAVPDLSPVPLALVAGPEVALVMAELSPEVAVAAEPRVSALVLAVADLSPVPLALVAGPEVALVMAELSPEFAVAAEPRVSALVFAVVDLSLGSLALVAVPGVAFVAVVSVAELQASADIAVAFVVLAPVSAVVGEVDSSGYPKFLAFPNADHLANSSSSVEVAGLESVHSPTGARTNSGPCSILSTLGLYQSKNWEHCYNTPSHGYNNVSETNDLPIDATTSHSRKRGLHQCQE